MATPYFKKLQRQRNLGNTDKYKNLYWRYRARTLQNHPETAGTVDEVLDPATVQKKLGIYKGVGDVAQKRTAAAKRQALTSRVTAALGGTPPPVPGAPATPLPNQGQRNALRRGKGKKKGLHRRFG